MTDRLKGLTVTLDNIRDDDAQVIIDAIKLIRGVIDVSTHVADMGHHFAVTAAKDELRRKLWDILK